ncbi:hypothetical protein T261_1441 [Streptomyces lydicus]|nr:hypothetical protein T261_1441 [Streptomyces lydicus]
MQWARIEPSIAADLTISRRTAERPDRSVTGRPPRPYPPPRSLAALCG